MRTNKLTLSCDMNSADDRADVELRFRSGNSSRVRGDNWALKVDRYPRGSGTGTSAWEGSSFQLRSDYGKSSSTGSTLEDSLDDIVFEITGVNGS